MTSKERFFAALYAVRMAYPDLCEYAKAFRLAPAFEMGNADGQYESYTGTVRIANRRSSSALEMADLLIHELLHAKQHVEGRPFCEYEAQRSWGMMKTVRPYLPEEG